MSEGTFVGYVGRPQIRDGYILQVEEGGDQVDVLIQGQSGRLIIIEFYGVDSVESKHPVGMMLHSLSEFKTEPHLRMFSFVNWHEDDDAFLEIVARDLLVLHLDDDFRYTDTSHVTRRLALMLGLALAYFAAILLIVTLFGRTAGHLCLLLTLPIGFLLGPRISRKVWYWYWEHKNLKNKLCSTSFDVWSSLPRRIFSTKIVGLTHLINHVGGDPSAGSPTDTLLRLNPPC